MVSFFEPVLTKVIGPVNKGDFIIPMKHITVLVLLFQRSIITRTSFKNCRSFLGVLSRRGCEIGKYSRWFYVGSYTLNNELEQIKQLEDDLSELEIERKEIIDGYQ